MFIATSWKPTSPFLKWGRVYQNSYQHDQGQWQVIAANRARTSNYNQPILLDVITCPRPRYLLAHTSSIHAAFCCWCVYCNNIHALFHHHDLHDNVIKWKHFPRYWPLLRGIPGGFPAQMPVTRNFDVFFDPPLNKRLSKQSRRRWFETPSRHPVSLLCIMNYLISL